MNNRKGIIKKIMPMKQKIMEQTKRSVELFTRSSRMSFCFTSGFLWYLIWSYIIESL